MAESRLRAFTLVEILIVVVILGILAAVVVPQFTEASDDARLSALSSDLSTVRGQLQMYRIHHNGQFPSDIVGQLIGRTKGDGTVMPNGGDTAQFPYGPYLQQFPTNPYVEGQAAEEVDTGSPGGGNKGWYYNSATGRFIADDDDHTGL